jgi:hypothetical protein
MTIKPKIEPYVKGSPEVKAAGAGMLATAVLSPFHTLASLVIGIERSRNVSFRKAFQIFCAEYTPKKVIKCNAISFFPSIIFGGSLGVARKLTEEAKEKAEEESRLVKKM